jgi:hypothetical protein
MRGNELGKGWLGIHGFVFSAGTFMELVLLASGFDRPHFLYVNYLEL